jgi:hypothetical protein
MKMIRLLPEQEEPVETGAIRFGDDWPGLFIRGDDCFAYALSLDLVLDSGYCGEVYNRAMLYRLLELLKETNINQQESAINGT